MNYNEDNHYLMCGNGKEMDNTVNDTLTETINESMMTENELTN